MNFVYCFSLCFVNILLVAISILNSLFIIFISKDRSKLRSVYSWYSFMRRRIFNIFNTIFAKHQRPIGFSISFIFIKNIFINRHSLIIFVISAKMICSIIQVCFLFIVKLRQSLLCTTVCTFANRHPVCYFQISATHFTSKYSHIFSFIG